MILPDTFLRQRLATLVECYQTLSPDTVSSLVALYATDASFKDPFNDVYGVVAIEQIFRHMFEQVEQPRFVVDESLLDGDQAVLIWRFMFESGKRQIAVQGSSHLRFDAAGRVSVHRDYWDAAGELYSQFPLIGGLMRWLSRRLSAGKVDN